MVLQVVSKVLEEEDRSDTLITSCQCTAPQPREPLSTVLLFFVMNLFEITFFHFVMLVENTHCVMKKLVLRLRGEALGNRLFDYVYILV
jgi:hypothetical protein